MKKTTCAFTGHRPKSFSWKYNEAAPDYILLKNVLADQIKALADRGVTDFLSGMAQGVDLWCTQIVLGLKEKNPSLHLRCILPCEGQEVKWPAAGGSGIIQFCSRPMRRSMSAVPITRTVCWSESAAMVDQASVLLAVYNGTYRSGTGMTVRYARQLNREIIVIDLVESFRYNLPISFMEEWT